MKMLEAKRLELKETQEAFVFRFGINQSQYSAAKNIKILMPFPKHCLPSIAQLLGLSFEEVTQMNNELREIKQRVADSQGDFIGRISYIKNQTLRLASLGGQLVEMGDQALLGIAKQVAQEMAIELNMTEALGDWPVDTQLSADKMKKFLIAVGVLAKACEAFDHLEDYPYRQNIERSIREILNL